MSGVRLRTVNWGRVVPGMPVYLKKFITEREFLTGLNRPWTDPTRPTLNG
jgi:hypothetical protein